MICVFCVSLLSKCVPKYFICCFSGNIVSPSLIYRSRTRNVFICKSTDTDLFSFTITFHFLNRVSKLFKQDSNLLSDSSVSFYVHKTVVSSLKVTTVSSLLLGMLAVYKIVTGLRHYPVGPPAYVYINSIPAFHFKYVLILRI